MSVSGLGPVFRIGHGDPKPLDDERLAIATSKYICSVLDYGKMRDAHRHSSWPCVFGPDFFGNDRVIPFRVQKVGPYSTAGAPGGVLGLYSGPDVHTKHVARPFSGVNECDRGSHGDPDLFEQIYRSQDRSEIILFICFIFLPLFLGLMPVREGVVSRGYFEKQGLTAVMEKTFFNENRRFTALGKRFKK